jgi:ElaB/YqjD/DUF883 family membrane-anchored ribosome-binding protein
MAARKTKSDSKSMDAKLDALRSDLEAIRTDLKKTAADGGDLANERAVSALRSAESVASRAVHLAETTAQGWADDVEAWTDHNLESARESVRAQPLSAILLSLGAGALLGAIFLRR